MPPAQAHTLTYEEAVAARARLHERLEMFARIQVDASILARTGRLAGPLGTLDALHLATALTWPTRLATC